MKPEQSAHHKQVAEGIAKPERNPMLVSSEVNTTHYIKSVEQSGEGQPLRALSSSLMMTFPACGSRVVEETFLSPETDKGLIAPFK